jgi:hypothetical protein
MSAENCTGITPKPDISGIGVRTAIYAQAVLTLVQPIIIIFGEHISENTLTGLHQIYLGILLPGCALLFSAIIEARTAGLSIYHAIIVLNLSWINNTSALIFFQFALIAQIHLDEERTFRKKVGVMWALLYSSVESVVARRRAPSEKKLTEEDQKIMEVVRSRAERIRTALISELKTKRFQWSKEIFEDVIQDLSALLGAGHNLSQLTQIVTKDKYRLRKLLGVPDTVRKREARRKMRKMVKQIRGGEKVLDLLQRDWIMAALASAHLTLFSAFGVWVWFTIHHFSECENLTNLTTLSIFVPIPVTSHSLRTASIVLYIIGLLPLINIAIFGGLEFGIIMGCRRLFSIRISPQSSLLRILKPTSSSRKDLAQFVSLTLLAQAYFVATTELTIHNNKHLLNQDSDVQESDWTFGQTLVMFLIVVPLVQLANDDNVKLFKGWFQGRPNASGGQQEMSPA